MFYAASLSRRPRCPTRRRLAFHNSGQTRNGRYPPPDYAVNRPGCAAPRRSARPGTAPHPQGLTPRPVSPRSRAPRSPRDAVSPRTPAHRHEIPAPALPVRRSGSVPAGPPVPLPFRRASQASPGPPVPLRFRRRAPKAEPGSNGMDLRASRAQTCAARRREPGNAPAGRNQTSCAGPGGVNTEAPTRCPRRGDGPGAATARPHRQCDARRRRARRCVNFLPMPGIIRMATVFASR